MRNNGAYYDRLISLRLLSNGTTYSYSIAVQADRQRGAGDHQLLRDHPGHGAGVGHTVANADGDCRSTSTGRRSPRSLAGLTSKFFSDAGLLELKFHHRKLDHMISMDHLVGLGQRLVADNGL